jgi:predicted deacetylase
MLSSIIKIKSKYTGLLIRMDDIAENMNWQYMDKCELLFDKYNLKPLLGVIPENKDPEFLKYPKNSDFWNRVKSWKKKGWEISMHGHTHLYQQETKKNDIFNYGGKSEFYGLDYKNQLSKIKLGLEKFKEKNISIKSFFAPNHTYDLNTLKALKECNIKIIIDGYGLFPYYKFDLLFIPQLFYKEILLPFGIQSTSMHINYWDNKYLQNFENFINKNYNKIIDIDYILNLSEPNFFKNSINYSVEKALKVIRSFR